MAYFHISIGQDAAGTDPVIRKIETKDIREALEEGLNDFWAMPSHAAFLGLVYPLCGMVLAYAPSYQNALQLLFPLASGFALGSVGIHREFITAATRWIMAAKLWSVFSARSAIRLNSLSLPKKFSIKWRHL